jgi:hypothetical protein
MRPLVACRFNKNHKMKITKLIRHEDICPDKSSDLLKCPYNPIHMLSADKFKSHLQVCNNRPHIDPNTKKEIKLYIEAKKNGLEELYSKYNTTNDMGSIQEGISVSNIDNTVNVDKEDGKGNELIDFNEISLGKMDIGQPVKGNRFNWKDKRTLYGSMK